MSERRGVLTYEGRGLVARRLRYTECWRADDVYRLDIEEMGPFCIGANGGAIGVPDYAPGLMPGPLAETLLGPPLILALALHDTFCLHASAVRVRDGVVAFAGESGAGKSTLAWHLPECGEGMERVADDILPVAMQAGEAVAMPRFPQLKLPDDRQPAIGHPERLPLVAIYHVSASASGQPIAIQPLSPRDAALLLVRHTAASLLFDRDLLQRHFKFCAAAAHLVPVCRLFYPHSSDCLPDLHKLLESDLASRA